jgi:hypothetical protein
MSAERPVCKRPDHCAVRHSPATAQSPRIIDDTQSLADRAEIGQWPLSCGCADIIVITVGDPPWVVLCMNHSIVRWYMRVGEC